VRAIDNSTATFNSTVGAGGPHVFLTTADPTNANQVLNVIYSLNSSLQQNPMHSLNTSTRWLAESVVYMGAGGGGGGGRQESVGHVSVRHSRQGVLTWAC
jgi:hypothetical protein